jgi:sugar/nucleoside kinase (ribokinase family)
LFCGMDDAARLFGVSGNSRERAQGLQKRFGCPLVTVTEGADGAAGCRASEIHAVPAFPVEQTVDRFGSGDAFAAGFLAGFLTGGLTLPHMLRLGAAAAALKRTNPGDMLLASRAEVDALARAEEDTPWR